MKVLSVTKDVEGAGGFVRLPISEIAYMAFDKKINRVVVHTPEDEYYLMGTVQYWLNAILADGSTFIWVDRTNVVNIDRIRYMDPILHTAYFVDEPTKSSKRCTLTDIRFDEIESRLEWSYAKRRYI
ncbi:hypothetical protein D3C75_984700 [compost metagenome]